MECRDFCDNHNQCFLIPLVFFLLHPLCLNILPPASLHPLTYSPFWHPFVILHLSVCLSVLALTIAILGPGLSTQFSSPTVALFLSPMDIVLEVLDTFLFDRFWSTIYPASTWNHPKNAVKDATTTFSSMRELPTAIHSSTHFFQLAPSRYAYMSEWPRDNIWRQFFSLYLITWYISRSLSSHGRQHFLTCPLGSSVSYSTSSLLLSHTSSSLITLPSLTPSISNTKSGLRFAKPWSQCR